MHVARLTPKTAHDDIETPQKRCFGMHPRVIWSRKDQQAAKEVRQGGRSQRSRIPTTPGLYVDAEEWCPALGLGWVSKVAI